MSDPLHIVASPERTDTVSEVVDTIPMRPSPLGYGMLRTGNPGNRGGATPSALRAALRDVAADRLTVLKDVSGDPDATTSDRLRAIELVLRFGLGEETTLTVGQVQSLSDRELDALADGVSLPDRILPDDV